jgi:hypothetical protein
MNNFPIAVAVALVAIGCTTDALEEILAHG